MARTVAYLVEKRVPGETFIAREIDALRRHNLTVDTISLATLNSRHRPASRAARLSTQGLLRRVSTEFIYNPFSAVRLLRHWSQTRALTNHLSVTGTRHLHAHFAWLPADLAGIAATTCGIPWTCSVHAWDIFTRPPTETARRLRSAAGIAACTQAAVQAVLQAGLPVARVHLIRHGLPGGLTVRQPAISSPPANLLAVGRLVPKKGFDTLVEACRLLTSRGIIYTCRIIGDGPERSPLEHAIRRAGLTANISVEPGLPPTEVWAQITAATLLILPSRRLGNGDRDGFANILTEAMALGTPVVTTTAGAAGEIIVNDYNGRLVPPDAPATLADTLAILLADAPARAKLAANARRTVAQTLDEATEIGKLIKMFEDVCPL